MKRHLLTGALLLVLASGCRGMESENEPIHPILNMDFQERYDPQEPNQFFENNMAMRQPPPGTVAKGFLHEDVRFYSGQTEEGNYVDRVPLPVTQALLERGRERYNIFCSVCHGQAGFGQGVIMAGNYGYTPAPTYHREALRDTADGYFYEVITNGVRNMPGYAAQVPVADRWAIVAYIRALQRSQNAQRENVPPSVLARIEQTGSANMNAARNPAAPPATGAATDGAATDGAATDGADTSAAAEESQPPAAAQDAAAQDTAAQDTAAQDTAGTAEAGAPADTAASEGAASADTASGDEAVGGDAAENVAAGAQESGAAAGSGESGGFFGTTFFVIVLVVLPILALMAVLVIAFRKDREH